MNKEMNWQDALENLSVGDKLVIDTRRFTSHIIPSRLLVIDIDEEKDALCKVEVGLFLKKWELTPKLGWLRLIGSGLFFDLKYLSIYRVSEDSYVMMDRYGADAITRSDLNNTCVHQEISKTGVVINVPSDFDENLK